MLVTGEWKHVGVKNSVWKKKKKRCFVYKEDVRGQFHRERQTRERKWVRKSVTGAFVKLMAFSRVAQLMCLLQPTPQRVPPMRETWTALIYLDFSAQGTWLSWLTSGWLSVQPSPCPLPLTETANCYFSPLSELYFCIYLMGRTGATASRVSLCCDNSWVIAYKMDNVWLMEITNLTPGSPDPWQVTLLRLTNVCATTKKSNLILTGNSK